MLTGDDVMFQVGVIMLIAFIGAALARRTRQSVMLGYILAGILIGPHMHIELGGFVYDGLLQDTDFIMAMSQLGLILLLFFVGLEFSFSKLKRTKAPATILAVINLGINMFAGIMLGTLLGWPIVDTIFLAGIVAMSSCAITAKSLFELERLANPETEFLLGMVIVEDFLAMVLLTIVGGLMVKSEAAPLSISTMALGIIVFYVFFIILAIWVIPRTVKHLKKIKSDEMFVLFALGVVFLSAALAEVSSVPAIIGAFFIGMVFAETQISERFVEKISPFRDAFVAVFFVSFGMLIDPAMFSSVIWIVVLAVPLVIINDVLITAALAYFLGFSAKGAVSMGTSLCGRGAESVMYASVGSRAVGSTRGAELFPFAGAFCFVMSAITPLLMRNSVTITEGIAKRLPNHIKYSGSVISRTLGKLVMPSVLHLYHRPKRLGLSLIMYFIVLSVLIATTGSIHVIVFGVAVVLTLSIWGVLDRELSPVVLHTNYSNIGVNPGSRGKTAHFVSTFVFLSLLTIICMAFTFVYHPVIALCVVIVYLFTVVRLMRKHYLWTCRAGHFPDKMEAEPQYPWEKPVAPSKLRKRNRWRLI